MICPGPARIFLSRSCSAFSCCLRNSSAFLAWSSAVLAAICCLGGALSLALQHLIGRFAIDRVSYWPCTGDQLIDLGPLLRGDHADPRTRRQDQRPLDDARRALLLEERGQRLAGAELGDDLLDLEFRDSAGTSRPPT